MKLKIAGIVEESIVDGPGVRFVVFTQGCPHHCKGCHNPQTHDFEGGYWIETQTLLDQIAENPLLKGVTISGGEPFCQPAAAGELAAGVHQLDKDVMVYTGYTFEELISGQVKKAENFLNYIDILVDGRFVEEKKSLMLQFRGSSNQRLLDCKKSLKFSRAIEIEL